MKEIIIDNRQFKNIINNNLQNFIINWANYKNLLSNCEILEDNEYENELIKNIQFLDALKEELNTNNMLNIELVNILNDIERRCWKVSYFHYDGIGYHRYFDQKLKQKIINNYNKDIKFSNQKHKKQIINNYFKTKQKRNKYENWKENYFRSINEKIIKNSIEEGIDVFEYFKDEINSNDLQNQHSTSTYQSNLSKNINKKTYSWTNLLEL